MVVVVVDTAARVSGRGGGIRCPVRPYSASHLSQRIVRDGVGKKVLVVVVVVVCIGSTFA